MRIRPSLAAGITAVALVTTACGGSRGGAGVVTSPEEAFAAIADSLDGPVRTRTTIDANIDLPELAALAEQYELDDPSADDDLAEFSEVADKLADHAIVTARGDNRTWSFALEYLGTNWVEFAFDASDAPAPDDYPVDQDGNFDYQAIEPFDLGIYGRVDLEAAIDVFEDFDPGSTDGAADEIADARAEAIEEMQIFPDLIPVIEAGFDGDWVGIDGELDIAGIFDMIGAFDPALLATTTPANQPSAAELMDLLEAAVTLRDFTEVDGADVATVDVHPRRGFDALLDFMQEYDTTGMAGAAYRDLGDEMGDLPETLSGVATVTFTGGMLSEVRLNGMAFAAAAMAVEAVEGSQDARAAQAFADVENTRFDIVTELSDHDDVGDVADVGATTITWSKLLQFAGMAMMGGGFA